MKFKVWSNIAFLIPFYLAIINDILWYSIVIGITIFFSILFHYLNEKKFKSIDIICAASLIISNFILLFISGLSIPYSLIAIFCAVVAVSFYMRQSKLDLGFGHGMWHIFSAATCYFSILTLSVK